MSDEEHGDRPLPLNRRPTPEELRAALSGDPLADMRKMLLDSMEPILAQNRERDERDSAIQGRIAVALEGIHAEMVEAREHPRFMPAGMMVVKENSPEHLQAKLAAGVPGSGVRRPT